MHPRGTNENETNENLYSFKKKNIALIEKKNL